MSRYFPINPLLYKFRSSYIFLKLLHPTCVLLVLLLGWWPNRERFFSFFPHHITTIFITIACCVQEGSFLLNTHLRAHFNSGRTAPLPLYESNTSQIAPTIQIFMCPLSVFKALSFHIRRSEGGWSSTTRRIWKIPKFDVSLPARAPVHITPFP